MRALLVASLLCALSIGCSAPRGGDEPGDDAASLAPVSGHDGGSGPLDRPDGGHDGGNDGGREDDQDAGVGVEDVDGVDGGTESDGGIQDAGGAPEEEPVEELPACPTFSMGTTSGFLLDLRVREASGVVGSRRDPDILWVHNDSGGAPEIFAITTTGAARGKFTLDEADFNDWEDIAPGPGPVSGETYLYLGDIGDNGTSRNSIQVYRVPEPTAGTASTFETLDDVERFTFVYPDGAHNAETLLVDPQTGDLFIVVKSANGVSPVFRAPAPLSTLVTTALEHVATLELDGPDSDSRLTTAGDISPLGDEIAIRTYNTAFVWRRVPGSSIAEALATEPCSIPLVEEGQGEALGYRADGSGYVTLGEGQAVGLHVYGRQ